MTTKPKITITPKEGNIQFDIIQGNQTRWFSVEEETARELYDILGDVLGEKEQEEIDWIEREMEAFLNRKNVEHSHSVQRDIGSSQHGTYGTERQHTPKTTKEETND